MKPLALSELQKQISEAITGESLSESIAPLVRVTPAFSSSQRLGVYQFAFRTRMIESLEQDFSITRKLIGDSTFEELVLEFVRKIPSVFPSIAEISRGFPSFLKSTYSESSAIFDVAQFEWILVETSNAWLASESTLSGLNQLPSDEQLQVMLRKNPSVCLFESSWEIDSLTEDSRELPATKLTRLAIYPAAYGAKFEALSQIEWNALSLLRDPIQLGNLGEKLESLGLSAEDVTNLFTRWSQRNFIVLVSRTENKEK